MSDLVLARDLISLCKIPQTTMLVFTALVGYLAAPGRFLPSSLALVLISELLAVSGTTSINMYHDRHVDSLMSRTRSRPIPSGRMQPALALAFGYVLLGLGIVLSIFVNWIFALTIFFGYFFDIWVYTLFLKRRSVTNILFGGLAGGMPILGGWVAREGALAGGGLLLFFLIMLWIPLHTWVISLVNYRDYLAAGIPMVPFKAGRRTVFLTLFFALAAFELASFELALMGVASLLMPAVAGGMFAGLTYALYQALILDKKQYLRFARTFASVFLGVSLIALLVR
ncbi:MAG: heme o synthase [TACK group archaeon]|nr:heme o synthase [TACK group archaeon]